MMTSEISVQFCYLIGKYVCCHLHFLASVGSVDFTEKLTCIRSRIFLPSGISFSKNFPFSNNRFFRAVAFLFQIPPCVNFCFLFYCLLWFNLLIYFTHFSKNSLFLELFLGEAQFPLTPNSSSVSE